MAKKPKQQPGIKSVEVAAGLLQALIAAGRPVPLKELSRLAHLHPGKAHRYLVSLTRTEIVMQDDASGFYGVGPLSIALGLSGLRNIDVVRISTALLPTLRDEVNETVLLSIWSPQGPVVFALEESSRPVSMNIRVGSILPLLPTATGRVFAAFMPRDDVSALIDVERQRFPQFSPAAVLEETRRHGLAGVEGTLVPGVNAISVPIFDHKGRVAGVIGALGRTEELDIGHVGKVADALRKKAAEVSRRLGQSQPPAVVEDDPTPPPRTSRRPAPRSSDAARSAAPTGRRGRTGS
jgi:DNA-binding IclR family transcriptional regulator